MARTRSRYDIRKGDLIEITCWFFDLGRNTYGRMKMETSEAAVLVLVVDEYGPYDEIVQILAPTGRLAQTLQSYIVKHHPGAR